MHCRPFHILLIILLLTLGRSALAGDLRDGDIIFQTSLSSQSAAIQAATGSRQSHMGIILLHADGPYVYEASRTVRATPLKEWTARGQGGHYTVKRLRNADELLTPDATDRLRAAIRHFLGRPYDLIFAWSDERIYCSELVWKAYDRALGLAVGKLQQLRAFNLDHPAVKAKLAERYGEQIPLGETVISPAAMFRSPLLKTVAEH